MSRGWLGLGVLALAAAVAGDAPAATIKTSFGVSVMVAASCRIIAGQANPCAQPAGQASAIVAEKPVVSFSRDPKTGLVTKTIEF